jgi:hypothetical protein
MMFLLFGGLLIGAAYGVVRRARKPGIDFLGDYVFAAIRWGFLGLFASSVIGALFMRASSR